MLIKSHVPCLSQFRESNYRRSDLIQNKANCIVFRSNITINQSNNTLTDTQVSKLKEFIINTTQNISKKLDLKHIPEINFDKKENFFNKVIGTRRGDSGYLFKDNSISFYLDREMLNLYKISVYENGEKKVLINDKTICPLYGSISKLSDLVKNIDQKIDFIIEPVQFEEYYKIFESLTAHELRHAKQYDVMRRTEGMELDKILEAERTGSSIVRLIDYFSDKTKNYAYWIDFKNEENQIKSDSEDGKFAQKCLESKKATNLIEFQFSDKVYHDNFMEIDAYEYAAMHVLDKYGDSPWGNYKIISIVPNKD